MDNPQVSKKTSLGTFFNRKKVKAGFTITERYISEDDGESFNQQLIGDDEDDDLLYSISSPIQTHYPNYTHRGPDTDDRKYQRHLNKFSKRVSMTPFDNRLPRSNSSTSLGSKFKQLTATTKKPPLPSAKSFSEVQKRNKEKWISLQRLNECAAINDPLTYAEVRLNTFLDYYDSILRDEPSQLNETEDILAYWSVATLKYLTGVNVIVTKSILTEFENFDLKHLDKMRILKLDDRNFSIEWAWQLAIDNSGAELYNYTMEPIVYSMNQSDSQGKSSLVGPPNFHPVAGGTLTDLPFSKNSFSFELAYNLFFELKEDEWVPVFTELYRVLQPQGTLNLFLMDFKPINCTNEKYNRFFDRIREFLIKRGMDPMPCKKIHSRLREAGFDDIKYSFISLKKGVPNNIGRMMELIQGFFEFAVFEKFAKMEMSEQELLEFREMKLQYHEDLRNGKLVEEFGDVYYMFAFGRKA